MTIQPPRIELKILLRVSVLERGMLRIWKNFENRLLSLALLPVGGEATQTVTMFLTVLGSFDTLS